MGPRPGRKDPETGERPPPRQEWDERHQVQWKNDATMPNGRSYFDRYRDRGDKVFVPRLRVRPYWRLDVDPSPDDGHSWQVFDAKTASFTVRDGPNKEPTKVRTVSDGTKTKRPRTPRRNSDLKEQREREKLWDKQHACTYSRNNQVSQVNTRSYFDRWKDYDGPGTRDVTWRLQETKAHELLTRPDYYTAQQEPPPETTSLKKASSSASLHAKPSSDTLAASPAPKAQPLPKSLSVPGIRRPSGLDTSWRLGEEPAWTVHK